MWSEHDLLIKKFFKVTTVSLVHQKYVSDQQKITLQDASQVQQWQGITTPGKVFWSDSVLQILIAEEGGRGRRARQADQAAGQRRQVRQAEEGGA